MRWIYGLRCCGLSFCMLPAACGESKMHMDGTMKMDGSMRLEGPVQIQMSVAGPSVKYEGTYVSEAMLERVKLKSTTSEWLIAVWGEPTGRAVLSDGTEIWRWSYQPVEEQASMVTVWSSGGASEPKVKQALTVVQLRDGVVIDRWRD